MQQPRSNQCPCPRVREYAYFVVAHEPLPRIKNGLSATRRPQKPERTQRCHEIAPQKLLLLPDILKMAEISRYPENLHVIEEYNYIGCMMRDISGLSIRRSQRFGFPAREACRLLIPSRPQSSELLL